MNPRLALPLGLSLTPTVTAILAAAAPVLAVAGMTNAVLMHRQVERARRDPLTGLLTRTGWTSRAERIIRDRHAVVVLLDLDDFKTVNDTHGHHAGDAVLVAIAARLSAWCGSDGVAGRLGGAEFVAAIRVPSHLDSREQGMASRIQLREALQQPVPGVDSSISVSVGFVRTTQVADADLSRLLQLADAAMYRAKAHGVSDYEAGKTLIGLDPLPTARRRGRLGTARGRRIEVAA